MPEQSSALGALLRQAQTFLTLAYLTMVGVGMLFYQQKYAQFDINIFQYADIFYFLVAPFEDPFILLLCFVAVALFLAIYAFDGFLREKMPRFYTVFAFGTNRSKWFEKSQPVSWLITCVLLFVIYAQIYGDRAKEKILASQSITIAFTNDETLTGLMIGKTDNTLFLLQGTYVKAIPLGAEVKEIVINASFQAGAEPASSTPATQTTRPSP